MEKFQNKQESKPEDNKTYQDMMNKGSLSNDQKQVLETMSPKQSGIE